jgi:hypothetical protein
MEGTGIYAGAGGACDTFLHGACPGGFSNEATLAVADLLGRDSRHELHRAALSDSQ